MFMATVKHAIPNKSIPLNVFSSTILYMDTGERIKQARKQMALTQEAFGKGAGVSKAAVSQWENGVTRPERDALLSLKRKYGLSPDWITSGKGHMFDNNGEQTPEELIESWPLLTIKEQAEFLEQIKRRADHNKEVMSQFVRENAGQVVKVADRRKKDTPLYQADRRKKVGEQ